MKCERCGGNQWQLALGNGVNWSCIKCHENESRKHNAQEKARRKGEMLYERLKSARQRFDDDMRRPRGHLLKEIFLDEI